MSPPIHRRTRAYSSRRVLLLAAVAVPAAAVVLAGYILLKPSTPAASGTLPVAVPVSVPPQKRGEVTFTGSDGTLRARVHVEIVDDESSRELGLMYRRSLGADYGMLFVFDSAAVQTFWMKNTLLPLDMIFVDAGGRIVTVHQNTKPSSLQTYASSEPALTVVEVNAGFARSRGIRKGDRMEWRRTEGGVSRP